MQFDKQALFAALKPKTVSKEIDGLGQIILRQLSVREVDSIRAKIKEQDDPAAFGLALIQHSVCDESGTSIFAEEDVPELAAASNLVMDALVSAALEVNGFKKPAEVKN